MLRNPILTREFTSSARSLKCNFLVWAYLLLLGGILLLLWPAGGIQSLISEKSKQIFALFFSIDLTLLILLVPAFTATAITYERENGTFGALFTTLMNPLEIMLGKLGATISLLVILVLLSMPIASICALTGGISMGFMLKILILLGATAISYGLMGLACSALCKASSTAIIMNYVLIMLLAGATWLPEALLSTFGFNQVWQIIRNISPFDALFFLLYPDNYKVTMATSVTMLNPFTIHLISAGIISLISLIFFYRYVLQSRERSGGNKQFYTGGMKSLKRKLNWPFYLFDPLKRKKPIRRFANPVFVAEMRSKLFANPKFVLRGVSVIFILSMVLLTLISLQFGAVLRAGTVRTVSIIFQIGVVAMLAPGVSSGLITDELAAGTFMSLRMTPVKPYTVITGKLKATFFYALIFIISSLFVLIAMGYLEQQDIFPEASMLSGDFWKALLEKVKVAAWWKQFWEIYSRIFIWVGILLLSTVTFLTAGLFASAFSKTTSIATAVAYSITAVVCLVSFAPVMIGDRFSHAFSAWILSFNPIAAAMQITNDAFESYPNLWINNLYVMCGLIVFFLVAATIRTWYLFHHQE